MLQWAGRGEEDPRARLAAARDLAGWLAGLPPHPRMVGTAMKSILADIGELDDWYLFHEYLAVHNRPVWFHELVARARAAGLRFLGEADFRELVPIDLPAEVQDALEARATDRETYEQLLDLVRERAFRKTLLVRPEVEPRYDVDSARLDALHVGARLRLPSELGAEGEPIAIASWPVGSPPRKPDEVHAFTALSEAEKRAAARIAAAWPSTVPVAELVAAAGEEAQAVRQRLLVAYLEEAVELFATPQASGRPSDRPVASALTRAECDHRGDEFVTSRWHGPIRVDAVQRWLLRRMDGTRDRASLAAELKAAFLGRRLPIPRDLVGGDEASAEWLDRTLQLFSDALLLEPE
jgi:hypothetical protein